MTPSQLSSPPDAPNLSDIRAAADRISRFVRRTDTVLSDLVSRETGMEVHLKLENRQRTGSFKPRGALNAAFVARGRGDLRGLLTFSSGNHGQAVALAAEELGVPCVVVSPTDVRPAKRGAMEARGARVETCGLTSAERMARAFALREELGYTLIPPYDDPDVVAGQGTVGLEVAEDAPPVDAVLVPVGGGGLIAGMATALAALRPEVAVIGVEPRDADDAHRSLAAGRLVPNERPSRSACDGLRGTVLGDLNWSIIRARVSSVVVVTEEEVDRATTLLGAAGVAPVEPSGAATTAALLAGTAALPGSRVVAVVSGGNAS